MKRYLLFAALLSTFFAFSQENATFSGSISDFSNGEELIGAKVFTADHKYGALTNEYGFFSNVNPQVDHPRWSQATERRIGDDGLFAKKRKTLMFNGYEPQVGQLYAGMDLRKFF